MSGRPDGTLAGSNGWVLAVGGPAEEFLLEFLFGGKVELVFAGVDVGVFGEGDFDHGFLFCLQRMMPMLGSSSGAFSKRSK